MHQWWLATLPCIPSRITREVFAGRISFRDYSQFEIFAGHASGHIVRFEKYLHDRGVVPVNWVVEKSVQFSYSGAWCVPDDEYLDIEARFAFPIGSLPLLSPPFLKVRARAIWDAIDYRMVDTWLTLEFYPERVSSSLILTYIRRFFDSQSFDPLRAQLKIVSVHK